MKFIDWLSNLPRFIYSIILMFRLNDPPKIYTDKKSKLSVLFLPGLLSRWGYYKPLLDRINNEGYPVYVIPSLGLNIKEVNKTAEIARDIIDEKKLKKVVVIGHSKGGLVGKYLLVNLNKDNKIINVISIASPFSGSNLARIFLYKRFQEFSPNSKLLNSLSQDTKVNSKIISIIPSYDELVWSKNKSMLNGAKNIYTKAGGHLSISNDRELVGKIIEELELISRKVK
jgi:triacylglycerol lipase